MLSLDAQTESGGIFLTLSCDYVARYSRFVMVTVIGKQVALTMVMIIGNPGIRHGYQKLHGERLPAVQKLKEVVIGGGSFLIGECKGEGAYGKVFKAMKTDEGAANETIADMDVVVKIQVGYENSGASWRCG